MSDANSICMSDEAPHAYDQGYSYSEASSFEYENRVNRSALNSGRPNHHLIVLQDPKTPGKKAKISVFTTNPNIGSRIVNAATGIPYYSENPGEKYVIGSKLEYSLFKVKDVTGRIQENNGVLFYDSPSQCERHILIKLGKDIHEEWGKRSNYPHSNSVAAQ